MLIIIALSTSVVIATGFAVYFYRDAVRAWKTAEFALGFAQDCYDATNDPARWVVKVDGYPVRVTDLVEYYEERMAAMGGSGSREVN